MKAGPLCGRWQLSGCPGSAVSLTHWRARQPEERPLFLTQSPHCSLPWRGKEMLRDPAWSSRLGLEHDGYGVNTSGDLELSNPLF